MEDTVNKSVNDILLESKKPENCNPKGVFRHQSDFLDQKIKQIAYFNFPFVHSLYEYQYEELILSVEKLKEDCDVYLNYLKKTFD